ncbi:MAG: DUF3300 domain-containing protein [Kangiellaceae bacterium]|nr:DUF3300 domain-containing protein [Kangiellaceae bacterium]
MKILSRKTIRQVIFSIFVLLIPTIQAEDSNENIEPFSQAELEQILAPIALYPDTVLSHILVASTYPLEVIQAERWTKQNPDVRASDAVEAVGGKQWDPSVKALVAFPKVLERLSENLEWTQKLGDAFLQDEEKVIASVQSLRQRAYDSGNLDKMEKVSVKHEKEIIIIEPIEREVIYVPYYDTRVVYGSWHWSHYPPVYWDRPQYIGHHYASDYSPFYWGPRVHISFGFFFSSFHWLDHHVVRIPRHHYRPNHYYDRRVIVRHQYVARWVHNPVHRRGVSYRSVTVSNRYRSSNASLRPSRAEVTAQRSNKRVNQLSVKSNSKRNSSTRIASPDRIKKELKDGRISIKERNSRPVNSSKEYKKSTSKNSIDRHYQKNPVAVDRTKQGKSKSFKQQPDVSSKNPQPKVYSQPKQKSKSSKSSRSSNKSYSKSKSSGSRSSKRDSYRNSSGSKDQYRSKSSRKKKH